MHESGEPKARGGRCACRLVRVAGRIAASFRDFDTAQQWLERASTMKHDQAWLAVCRAKVFELEDRYEEALAAAREALELQPWYCPAVDSAAHLLTLLDRDSEAAEMLAEATVRTESPQLVAHLYAMRLESRQYETAGAVLERCASLAILADKRLDDGWRPAVGSGLPPGQCAGSDRSGKAGRPGVLCDDRRSTGRRISRQCTIGLAAGRFVRQHHVTCGPATLSAVSRFWQKPADHLEVADEICYNGTTAYHERKWAETHGWETREFTVTEQSAASLLDRGVPFTFTTIDPGNAHLQAVIGYDGRRGTFWIRDPFGATRVRRSPTRFSMATALTDRADWHSCPAMSDGDLTASTCPTRPYGTTCTGWTPR